MRTVNLWKWSTFLLLAVCVGAGAAGIEQPIALRTAQGAVAGTLSLPKAAGPVPVALIIAGSGPTDRDGNGPGLKNDSLRLLAQGLADAGVASVRFDKRGIAASAAAGPREADLRFETYIDDATAWQAMLRADKRFSSVSVIGYSEGSLIGMLAAKAGNARAYVSIGGLGRGASAVLREQLAPVLPPPLARESERILTALEDGREAGNVPIELAALYRASVQPYLISWFKYVPATVIKDLRMPVLLVQGSTDLQVPLSEAELLHRALPGAHLVVVPGMNHVLKEAPLDKEGQTRTYTDPAFPLAPTLVPTIAAFLRKASKD
ncbi:alpha/beta hydrolase [Massilia pseudoviolaceinigra]|uniref:alpha/beta hydrolase n=1 Tax=Massilia pseudoviolaceinigra TaxID=3057165 RepID=UPI0027967056|nr:alpha/beta hydrolase [Massilia sp. CCM 9206]MDQ1921234.1 alpha/beta hydrolase [Massilia sp. CCM 9206]